MSKEELENWQRVKEHFESLPEEKRNNWFYKRAVAICGGKSDPMEPLKQGSSVSNSMAIRKAGEVFSGYNKPKRTPNHPKKSHAVLAKQGNTEKLIRFGQQGVKGAGKNPKSEKDKARKKSYYARHNAQDSKPSKLSARYWSHKVKW